MTIRPLLPLLLALGLGACATEYPPGFVGPSGWVPDYAASPTPWNYALVAGNVAGDEFFLGDWR